MGPQVDGPVAFIGVGKIGTPMAARLIAAGHELVVYDKSQGAAERMAGSNVEVAESAAAAVEACETVFTCLPGPSEFNDLLFGDDSLAGALRQGSILVDHTTNSPEVISSAAARLEDRGVSLIDVPVSGGVEGARTGDLTALVGGSETDVVRVRPYLDAMCSSVFHLGPVGSGTVAKLMNNLACFTLDQVIAECLTIGVKAGADPQRLFDALKGSALGKGGNINVRLVETFMRSDFEPRFTLAGAHKDLSLALELADSLNVPLRITPLALSELREAVERGLGDRDASIAMTLQEERSGVRARPIGGSTGA